MRKRKIALDGKTEKMSKEKKTLKNDVKNGIKQTKGNIVMFQHFNNNFSINDLLLQTVKDFCSSFS